MSEKFDKPYLEKPSETPATTEQLIYGGGETLSEVQSESNQKKKTLLTE